MNWDPFFCTWAEKQDLGSFEHWKKSVLKSCVFTFQDWTRIREEHLGRSVITEENRPTATSYHHGGRVRCWRSFRSPLQRCQRGEWEREKSSISIVTKKNQIMCYLYTIEPFVFWKKKKWRTYRPFVRLEKKMTTKKSENTKKNDLKTKKPAAVQHFRSLL